MTDSPDAVLPLFVPCYSSLSFRCPLPPISWFYTTSAFLSKLRDSYPLRGSCAVFATLGLRVHGIARGMSPHLGLCVAFRALYASFRIRNAQMTYVRSVQPNGVSICPGDGTLLVYSVRWPTTANGISDSILKGVWWYRVSWLQMSNPVLDVRHSSVENQFQRFRLCDFRSGSSVVHTVYCGVVIGGGVNPCNGQCKRLVMHAFGDGY